MRRKKQSAFLGLFVILSQTFMHRYHYSALRMHKNANILIITYIKTIQAQHDAEPINLFVFYLHEHVIAKRVFEGQQYGE